MRPPFAYYGGKVGMARRILSLVPPHQVYIEPFFGSGAVFFAKTPARHEIINDVDGQIINFFRVLRERPVELEEVCGLSPYARDEFNDALSVSQEMSDLERARRFWVRVNQSFAKTAGTMTGWSITTARTQTPPVSVLSRLGRFSAVSSRLMNAMIENCDAVDLIDRLATRDSVVYCDPPYVSSTRVGRTDTTNVSDYTHEFSVEDHRRLAEVLHATPAVVILSGYASDLYQELYADWWTTHHSVMVHSSNAKTKERIGRVETLWMNKPPSTLFSDAACGAR